MSHLLRFDKVVDALEVVAGVDAPQIVRLPVLIFLLLREVISATLEQVLLVLSLAKRHKLEVVVQLLDGRALISDAEDLMEPLDQV